MGADYGFMGDDEEKSSPILVTKVNKDRWISSDVLPSKGAQHPWNAQVLAREMVNSGFGKLILKSDQEKPIRRLCDVATELATRETGKEILPENSPVGESQSNGLVENAVKEVKAMMAEADEDGDGFLDAQEFENLLINEVKRYKSRSKSVFCSLM